MNEAGAKKGWVASWREDKPVRRNIIRLAWPTVTEQVLISLVAMFSTAMIGRISTAALGCVGVVTMTVTVIQSFMAILAMGATIVVARLTGAGDVETARRAAQQALLGGMVVAVVLPIILFFASESLMHALLSQADEDVVDNALTYFRFQLPGLPLFILNLVVSGIFRGTGEMRRPMAIALIVNVLALAVGYPMIFGIEGVLAPQGIAGAGIGLSVARTVGGIISLGWLVRGKVRMRVPLKGLWRFDWPMMRRVLRVGTPASIESVALMGGNLLVQVVIAMMPKADMAAYQILGNLGNIPHNMILGLGMATTTMVGQYLGAKKSDLAERGTWYATILGLSTNVVCWLMFAFMHPLATFFTNDQELIRIVMSAGLIFAVAETFLTTVNVIPAALRGGGDVMFVSWSNILGVMIFRVGGTYVLSKYAGLGISALYITMGTDYFLRSLACYLRFKGGKWKRIQV